MIYVIGFDSDLTFLHFLSATSKRGIKVQPINLSDVVLTGEWRIALPDDGESFVSVPDQKIELNPMSSYYCRLINPVTDQFHGARRWRNFFIALCAWLEHIPGTVIGRPGCYCDNSCKPLHEYTLQRFGFNVPASLTSAVPSRLINFANEAPTIIKSISGARVRSRLVEAGELHDFQISRSPIHLQRYVAGADIRVHVVGEYVHAELIRTSAIDYRITDQPVEFSPYNTLPASLAEHLVKATAEFGLIFAGWDFKVSEDNKYWCLEANPMPAYDSYDRRLNGQITESLLNLLDC